MSILTQSSKISATQLSPRNINSGLNPFQGPFDRSAVIHLLKRTMFGASLDDINHFSALTMTQAVEELINPTSPLPQPPLNDYHNNTADPNVAAWQTWVNSQTNDGTLNALRVLSFKKWWSGVMINQDRSIREKLSLFWSNHWGTETDVIKNAILCYNHHKTLRSGCLGNFKTMVKNITIDSGMLIYLNGYLNTKLAPDENYGREIQELFTIGKDPVTNLAPYTEEDVKSAAKVLTGWRINVNTGNSYFDPNLHDATNKSFSTFYNGRVITGRSGAAGALETDDLIDMLFDKNETAKHIVRKLYRWFVYYEIDDQVEQIVIEPLAAIFQQNNYEIKPVLRTLLSSEHFFDLLNRGCMIKSPCDLVVGHLREYQVVFPDPSDLESNYGHWSFTTYFLNLLTQSLGDPPGVSGWPAYYQQPLFHEIWINHDSLPKRNQFTDYLIYSGYSINNTTIKTDGVSFARRLPNPGDPNELLSDAMKVLLGVPLTATSLSQLKNNFLLSGQASDGYWTNAWNTYVSNPTQANFNVVNSRLRDLLKYFMNLAEYQLC
ncbi:MAG: hypothetical protein RIR96_479 [Bacteroidota bacterium]